MSITAIQKLVARQTTGMISYIDEEGFPCMKAMLAPRKTEGLKVFYFTTNTSSKKVTAYQKSPNACMYFADDSTFEGVSFTGTMEILTDDKTKQMIWQKGDVLFYPKGVTDEDYCVLAFTAQKACYYQGLKQEIYPL